MSDNELAGVPSLGQVTDEDFLFLFVHHPKGALILDHLIRKFSNAAVLEGDNAAFKTYYNCGTSAVPQYLLNRINRATKGDLNAAEHSEASAAQ